MCGARSSGRGSICWSSRLRAWWRRRIGREPSDGSYLLAPIGPTRFRTVFRATIIGFAALAVLPARAGDVLRPYLVARQEGLSLSSAFATIVIERVLDLIAVLLLLAVYLVVAADCRAMSPVLLRSVDRLGVDGRAAGGADDWRALAGRVASGAGGRLWC